MNAREKLCQDARTYRQNQYKKPMFHVEQFDFDTPFHVERQQPKTHCLVGVLALFTAEKIIFTLSPCKI